MLSHHFGWIELFSRLVTKPEVQPKACRMSLTAMRPSLEGLIKIAASSAYREVLGFAVVSGMGEMISFLAARSRIRCSGSMARMNNIRERGSPCLYNPSPVLDVCSLLAIEEGSRRGRPKKDGNPLTPTSAKTHGLEDFQEITLINCVESLLDVKLQEERRFFCLCSLLTRVPRFAKIGGEISIFFKCFLLE
jgi:hypothetical protein